MKRRSIAEGMVFAVPLRSGRYARGLVTRHGTSAVTVGHFFGPALDDIPRLPAALEPCSAILVARFGDIPIANDEWKPLGELPNWDRSEWPSITFFRGDQRGRGYVVIYDDHDPNKVLAERPATPADVVLPRDSLYGYVIVQNRLTERDLGCSVPPGCRPLRRLPGIEAACRGPEPGAGSSGV